jgi:hypothetical protein
MKPLRQGMGGPSYHSGVEPEEQRTKRHYYRAFQQVGVDFHRILANPPAIVLGPAFNGLLVARVVDSLISK